MWHCPMTGKLQRLSHREILCASYNSGFTAPRPAMTALLPLFLLLLGSSFAAQAALMARDDTGVDVLLTKPASRIVSLAPHATENLFAAGAGNRVVGVVDYSDFPAPAKQLPKVGGYDRPDLEAIMKLKPDLVVGWESGNPPRLLNRLQALGVPVYRTQPGKLEDIAREIERLGILAGSAPAAKLAAAEFRKRIDGLRARHGGRSPVRLFYQVWNQPLLTVGGTHVISEAMGLCGGVNIFAKQSNLAPMVTTEAVINADPDVIIASGMGRDTPVGLEDWKRWKNMKAVARGHLFHVPADLMQRSTPRLLDGVEILCGQLEKARGGRPAPNKG